MSSQLDILAIEPFCRRGRKHMLETMIRCSKHRWTLPQTFPTKNGRRLAAAAHWFRELLTRHWSGRIRRALHQRSDEPRRSVSPRASLAKQTVVRFISHSNQLPAVNTSIDSDLDIVNSHRRRGDEIWFNLAVSPREFFSLALRRWWQRHPELFRAQSEPGLTAQSPDDARRSRFHDRSRAPMRETSPGTKRLGFLETRDADARLITAVFGHVDASRREFRAGHGRPVDRAGRSSPASHDQRAG